VSLRRTYRRWHLTRSRRGGGRCYKTPRAFRLKRAVCAEEPGTWDGASLPRAPGRRGILDCPRSNPRTSACPSPRAARCERRTICRRVPPCAPGNGTGTGGSAGKSSTRASGRRVRRRGLRGYAQRPLPALGRACTPARPHAAQHALDARELLSVARSPCCRVVPTPGPTRASRPPGGWPA